MEYRRKAGEDEWHFCEKCPKWPMGTFDIIIPDKLPSAFEVCKQCTAIARGEVN